MYELIDSFPAYFKRDSLKAAASPDKSDGSIPFANISLDILHVRKEYQNHEILGAYDNRPYASLLQVNEKLQEFIGRSINYSKIVEFVVETVKRLPATGSIRTLSLNGAKSILAEIELLNTEMNQFALELSYTAEGSLHTLCKQLLWKRSE